VSRTRAVTILAVGVLLAACGSDGDSDAGASPEETRVRTSASSSSVVETTTVNSSRVGDPASPASSSTAATSAVVTTAAPHDLAVAREKAVAAYVAKQDAWSTCLSQLPACDTDALAVAYTEPQLSLSRALAEEWNSAGYHARNRESMTHRVEDVSINETHDTAIVTLCITDGGILYVPSSDGRAEQIIDDTWQSAREAWTMVKGTDGIWRASENTTLTDPVIGEENNICV